MRTMTPWKTITRISAAFSAAEKWISPALLCTPRSPATLPTSHPSSHLFCFNLSEAWKELVSTAGTLRSSWASSLWEGLTQGVCVRVGWGEAGGSCGTACETWSAWASSDPRRSPLNLEGPGVARHQWLCWASDFHAWAPALWEPRLASTVRPPHGCHNEPALLIQVFYFSHIEAGRDFFFSCCRTSRRHSDWLRAAAQMFHLQWPEMN